MTDTIKADALVLEQALETRPADMEHRLSTAMRSIGSRIVQKPEIVRALTAAESIPAGVVVTNHEQAAELADLVAQVIDGEKTLKLEAGLALRIPRQMEEALKQAIAEEARRLATARLVGNEARVAFQAAERRRAAKQEAERQAAAAEAAKQASVQAGEEIPVAEVAPIVVPRTVSGGVGKQGTMVRVEPGEIVMLADVPPEWLTLIPAIARAVFLSDEVQGKVKRAAPGESVVYKGVRFTSVESAVNRR